jgi:serine protease Do
MTNNHVVDRASEITVELSSGVSHSATVIGTDEATDLAVIKINAGNDLITAKFGNSDSVKVGDWVLAIGSPFDFDHTVTAGIISAKGRSNNRLGATTNNLGLQKFLQTDAAINPGNSGGPLVNMAGEVIGVNTAIVSETNSFAGLGFALPSNTALNVYNQLSQRGKVTRGSIGISFHPSKKTEELEAYGFKGAEAIIVDNVLEGSPAEKAGLRQHDIITEIDGKKVSGDDLQDYIVGKPVGASVRLGLLRDGKTQTATVTIGDRAELFSEAATAANTPNRTAPRGGSGASTSNHIGITVEAMTPQQRRQIGLEGGVVITDVQQGSVAERAGLEEGMIVTGARTGGRQFTISTVADLATLESRLSSGSSVVVYARQGPQFDADISFPMRLK